MTTTADILRTVASRYDLDVAQRQKLYTSPYRKFFARAALDGTWLTLAAALAGQGIISTAQYEDAVR